MNRIITKCCECADWGPANKLGYGVYCSESRKILSEKDTDMEIPADCPHILEAKSVCVDCDNHRAYCGECIRNSDSLQDCFRKPE